MTEIQATKGIKEGRESNRGAVSSQKDKPKDGEGHGAQHRRGTQPDGEGYSNQTKGLGGSKKTHTQDS